MSKTIGIDVTSALTQGGGIGRYTRELVNALSVVDSDTQYKLFSAKPPAQLPVANPLPQAENFCHLPTRIDESWLYRIWYRARLPLPIQLATGKIDLFHSPDFVLPPTSGNIPTLLTVHDLSFVHFPHVYTKTLVDYLNKVVPWSVGRATHILADSQATKDDIIAQWGTPKDKVTVLYAAAGTEFEPVTNKNMRQTIRQRYGLADAPYLLAVGTVQPRKNYQMLIKAFRPIAQNWPHNLVIAGGKGWLYDDILAEIEAQGLTGRVIFTGFVADEDLPALYSEAALFLMPSIYEGFGIPILEAMGCGVPVISSDTSCLPEVVADAGVLLSSDDQEAWTEAIHRLLLDAPRRTQLVGKGAIQARKFSWGIAARQLKALYEQLLTG